METLRQSRDPGHLRSPTRRDGGQGLGEGIAGPYDNHMRNTGSIVNILIIISIIIMQLIAIIMILMTITKTTRIAVITRGTITRIRVLMQLFEIRSP